VTELLRVEGLSKRFGGLSAVQDLSFSVEEGEIVGIIGPNGAGKTTILNLISNVYAPNSGKILYQGVNIVGSPSNRVAKMGLIRTFQSTVSYGKCAVWENIIRAQLGRAYSGLWSEFLITRAVQEKRKMMVTKAESLLEFLGLDAMANVEARSMPYGYQKLLGLAIALAGEHRLLMLDEPAAGLNQDESIRLMNSIKKINGNGVTIILVEHDMKVVMGLCHRIVVINYGEMIATGTPSEIQHNDDVIKAYLGEDHEYA
jgi:branched-chain amino acid transport system ATP-binding protein